MILYINANIPAHKEARENFSLIDYCHYLILYMKEVLIYPIKGIYFIQRNGSIFELYKNQFGHLRIISNVLMAKYSIYAKNRFLRSQKDIGKKDINQYLWHINFKIDLTAVHCTKFFPLFFY